MARIVGYARWKGTMDSSSRDMPAFVYAETTWNAENLDRLLKR